MSGNESGLTSGEQQTVDQLTLKDKVAENESNASSSFTPKTHGNTSVDYSSYPKTLNEDKQGKHIPGHPNYQSGKSRLTISMSEATELVKQFSGKGEPVSQNKERVDFGRTIGVYRDSKTGEEAETTVGIIHYSKSGAHIVPARPNMGE